LRYRLEILFELALGKLVIFCLPFAFWSARLCGKSQCETLRIPPPDGKRKLGSIGRAIQDTAKHLPWKSKCFDQAIAAQRMLARRRRASTLYLGMAKTPENQWTAHAWVRSGDEWVVGYDSNRQYTIVGTYAKFASA